VLPGRVTIITVLKIRNRYGSGMTDPWPGTRADDVPALDAAQLDAYFALMEAAACSSTASNSSHGPSPDDDRATLVTITDSGLALLGRVMPGHVQVTRRMLLGP
jgi:hypothetical protein